MKFQTVFRGKRGRDELKLRQERERRVKALCRRCLGDAGRLAFLGFREFLVVARAEKERCALKLQGRWRIKAARKKVDWEKKERNRKEELIALALGRNTDRLVRRCIKDWYELLEMKRGATVFQGLFRKKKSREEVAMMREKKKKTEVRAGEKRLQKQYIACQNN